eukprot:TRINITY_DN12523_c3_g1_i1.p1 TRINITY_DN12523_c3_g1~~TRINITY_DN12523_c3_g1_i1.p1  ORF type:complete len:396 (+),score=112.19 TRINITY_DN12523_c3_g1_i1:155-1342(+)
MTSSPPPADAGVGPSAAQQSLLDASGACTVCHHPPLGARGAKRLPPSLDVALSGAVAGVVSRTSTAPLDRLRTLMALRDAFRDTQKVKLSSRSAGVFGGLRMIHNEGGITAFWRGNFTNVLKVMPETAIKFVVFERLKPRDGNRSSLIHRFAAGATAGMVGQALVYPLDVIKTRLAASETGLYRHELRYGGMLGHVVRRMLKYEGWRSLYRGMGVSLLGMIPYAGLDLMLFESMKVHYKVQFNQAPPWHTMLAIGCFSSIVAQTATYPLGVVRMRLQAQGMSLDRPIRFSGPLDCFVQTYHTNGLRGLYSGYIPSLMKVAPAAAISYTVYEHTKARMSQYRRQQREEAAAAAPPCRNQACPSHHRRKKRHHHHHGQHHHHPQSTHSTQTPDGEVS